MTHPDDIEDVKVALRAFYDKHKAILEEGNAGYFILEAILDLSRYEAFAQDAIEEDAPSEFNELAVWNKAQLGVK